jgi:hypothetical protein
MKKLFAFFLLVVLAFVIGCSENSVDPIAPKTDNSSNLKKNALIQIKNMNGKDLCGKDTTKEH